jgi:undecaprenyl-diphosphatase
MFQTRRRAFFAGGLLLYLAVLGVVAYLASSVHEAPGELEVSLWLQSWRASWLDSLMYTISVPGFWEPATPIVVATVAYLFFIGRRRESAVVLLAISFAAVANIYLKELIARPRPPDSVAEVFGSPSSFGFPSGHVMTSVVFLGMLVFLFTYSKRPCIMRTFTHVALALALLAVGLSRMYLGVHTLGDVLGGYAFGAGIVLAFASIWLLWAKPDHKERTRPAGQEGDLVPISA